MLHFLNQIQRDKPTSPRLYDDTTFYKSFVRDLSSSRTEILIESPFIAAKRVNSLLPYFKSAISKGVKITINTKDPHEHEDYMMEEAFRSLELLSDAGIAILYTGELHRKVAVIDRKTVWLGSLNILSQNDSCEIMEKHSSRRYASQILNFTMMAEFLAKNQ